LPDFSVSFELETDSSSGAGIGAILSQKGHAVALFSKIITAVAG
jgi:hypothetical protein